ncbi:MAG: hypothetical protein K2M69_00570 [Muribaculaceae bacterium]|nr:hypothetical protein [Muribaculaceae bacterium]
MTKPGKVGWGKPNIYIKDLDTEGAGWEKIPTPAENTTKLTPTKGDKKEALLEGGDPEDVKYNRNKYALEYQIRRTGGKKMPIRHEDGVVANHYVVVVVPENRSAPGPYLPETAVTVDDAFTTADGGTDLYQHDAVAPADNGKKVRWGTYNVTKGENGKIEITASGEDFGETPVNI